MAAGYQVITPKMLASLGLELKMPLEIGSLDKGNITVVSEWEVAVKPSGYGMGYKSGAKYNLTNPETSFLLYFWLPLVRAGTGIVPESIVQVHNEFLVLVQGTSQELSKRNHKDFIVLNPPIPDYLVGELETVVQRLSPDVIH